MAFWAHLGLALALAATPASNPATKLLELRGKVTLPESHRRRAVVVGLHGIATTYMQQRFILPNQTFKFPHLEPGTYTVVVSMRGAGEVRKTIDVSPSLADSKGRVWVDLRLETTSADPSRLGATVSVRRLSIPEKALDLYNQAIRSLGKRDSDRAVELLEKAIAKAPQFAEALNTLGTIYNQRRDYPKAEECFREALAHSPTAFEPTVNLGGVLLAQGHLPEALQYNRKAVAARPDDALAQGQLGWVLLNLGQMDEAIAHLEEAKRLDPGHFTRPQLGLAEIYAKRSERVKAAVELEDYLRLHPDDPEAPKMRAQIFRLRNEPRSQ